MNKDQKASDEVDTRVHKEGVVCHCFSPDLKSNQTKKHNKI